ncbi:MAG TPA: hypothetical protein VMZ53_25965 [Kofleriaceae bacterium]|nr:hypothetical protein [Kofleriaceae bacterium]
MKLFLAGVAAVAMFGCADQPETTGRGGISPAKHFANPAVSGATQFEGMQTAWHMSLADLSFSDQIGTVSESMNPQGNGNPDEGCADCEVIAIRTGDGLLENIDLLTVDGTYLCSIRQTAVAVLSNSCGWIR